MLGQSKGRWVPLRAPAASLMGMGMGCFQGERNPLLAELKSRTWCLALLNRLGGSLAIFLMIIYLLQAGFCCCASSLGKHLCFEKGPCWCFLAAHQLEKQGTMLPLGSGSITASFSQRRLPSG